MAKRCAILSLAALIASLTLPALAASIDGHAPQTTTQPDGSLACNEGRARTGDDTVILACKAAVAADPSDDVAFANLCAALSDDMLDPEQLKGALGYCDEAIRLNPKSILAHKNRADVLARLGRHQQSMADVNNAVELARGDCALR